MHIISDEFYIFGMELNMTIGKTSLQVMANGTGASALKATLALFKADGIPVVGTLRGDIILRLAAAYKRMGTNTVASGATLPEIVMRNNSAKQALKPLGAKLFRVTRVEHAKKFGTAASITLPPAFYGSGGWPVPTIAERRAIRSKTMTIFRSVANERLHAGQDNLPDADLLKAYEIRSPYNFVRFSRLRLSVRLISKAPLALLALLAEASKDSKSLIKAFNTDLKWMGLVSPDFIFSQQAWFNLCRTSPKRARSIIRQACDSHQASDLQLGESVQVSRQIVDACTCECGAMFKSKAALAVHQSVKHGVKVTASRYIDMSLQCRACLTQFSTHQ